MTSPRSFEFWLHWGQKKRGQSEVSGSTSVPNLVLLRSYINRTKYFWKYLKIGLQEQSFQTSRTWVKWFLKALPSNSIFFFFSSKDSRVRDGLRRCTQELLVVQRLRLHAPKAGHPGEVPGHGNGSPCWSQGSQTNKHICLKKKDTVQHLSPGLPPPSAASSPSSAPGELESWRHTHPHHPQTVARWVMDSQKSPAAKSQLLVLMSGAWQFKL